MLKYLLYFVFIFGIYGAGTLAYTDFTQGDVCPKLLDIPACYIILTCLVFPFISHLLKRYNFIYYTGTGIALSIALYGSIMQIIGEIECPKTSSDIPMCYISFVIFTLLISLKFLTLNKTSA